VLELKSFSLPITIIAVVGAINAFNMLDGIDGLAGTVATIIFITLAILALSAGDISSFQLLGILSVSTFVFVLFNWRFYNNKKSLAFMGDSGSLFLGFVIAYYLIKLSQGAKSAILPITALWIFAFPIIDTMTMLFRRLMKGQSPFLADREHFHHLLQQAGFSINKTTFIIIMINVVCIAIGITIEKFNLTESYMFYAFILLFIIYYYIIMRSWKVKRFLKRQFHAER